MNGAFQSYKYQSLAADVDYKGDRIGLDATLQQSPTESITAKGTVPMTLFKPGQGGHVAGGGQGLLEGGGRGGVLRQQGRRHVREQVLHAAI